MTVLTHTPRVLAAYLRRGEEGLDEIERQLYEEASKRPGNKFSKRQAFYLPQSPFLPLLWRNQCERCRFWQEGGPGEAGRCGVVGQKDDPFGGEAIHPRGWCGYWMPPEGEPAFAWVRERLNPDGASTVRGMYDANRRGDRNEVEREWRNEDRQEATIGGSEGGDYGK